MTPYLAHAAAELRLAARQGEQLLVSLGIPLLLLGFFTTVDVLPSGDADPVDFLTPGILALAVMGSAMVSLGIGTGFERSYGVLKRLGTTPLGRPRLVAAKITVVLVTTVLQVLLVSLPPLQDVFATTPLDAGQWAICVVVALTVLVTEELRKAVLRRGGANADAEPQPRVRTADRMA